MIFEGAMAFLSRQYRTIAIFAVLTSVLIGVIVGLVSGVKEIVLNDGHVNYGAQVISPTTEGLMTGIAFLVGAFCSGLAGYIGMYIAVRSNVRTAAAAQKSLKDAITVALRGGAVSGFLVVALSLIGVSTIFAIYSNVLGNPPSIAPFLIVGFGFGASFVALFAQLGGGIYTKAADVGADLVGKVEAGIPEDDPRNAAVVADLVGDNVGDCAGRGADLFESMSAENIGAMILGVAIYTVTGRIEWIMFPLVLRSFGVFATIIGLISVPFFIKDDGNQDPMAPLNYGYYVVSVLSVVGLVIATKRPAGRRTGTGSSSCGIVGILTGIAFVYITQYYTAGSWRPVQEIADASRTGPATNIIIGTAVGFETTALTALAIGTALVASFTARLQRRRRRLQRRGVDLHAGIFGTAVATMGMLMSAAYVLAMDTFGPITDNAGGITEISGAPAEAREITDALDAVGNTTKALTKGYAVASAGLAAFLLFSAYLDKVKERLGHPLTPSSRSTLPTSTSSSAPCSAHAGLPLQLAGHPRGRQARRRHHRRSPPPVPRRPGHHGRHLSARLRPRRRHHGPRCAEGDDRCRASSPSACRSSSAWSSATASRSWRAAQRHRRLPSEDAGWLAVSGLLIVGTIAGILMATFLNNSGGAWDNAKKFIEAGGMKDENGNVIGKGSDTHAAAVVGDTVGDPFKDTAGPSLHVLVKLLARSRWCSRRCSSHNSNADNSLAPEGGRKAALIAFWWPPHLASRVRLRHGEGLQTSGR